VGVEEYAYYVNKLRQNVGLETWIWRQIVTSQTAHTKYEWPTYATGWNPHKNFLRTPLHVTWRFSFSNITISLLLWFQTSVLPNIPNRQSCLLN